MNKPYYILAINYGSGYSVEFGEYTVNEILDFKYDILKDCALPYPSIKTICTIDDQRAINAAIENALKKG